MRFFLLGDFCSDDGPGVANRQILEAMRMNYDITVSMQTNALQRITEVITECVKSHALVICSKSELNYLAITWANILRKPVYYVMHGFASYEEQLNDTEKSVCAKKRIQKLRKYDDFVVSHSDKIICVSPFAMRFMQREYPEKRNRFDYIYNTVQPLEQHLPTESYVNTILSVGAHMPRKMCFPVVRAVEKLREQGRAYRLILVGTKSAEYEKIKAYAFVEWHEPMAHEELLKLMARCPVYIQNSAFDTFALAPIEALYEGASILLSKYVGCKDLFNDLRETDIISDPENEEEIASDIDYVMQHANHQRLLSGMRGSCATVQAMAQRLAEIFDKKV